MLCYRLGCQHFFEPLLDTEYFASEAFRFAKVYDIHTYKHTTGI